MTQKKTSLTSLRLENYLDNLRPSLMRDLLTMTLWQDWYTQGCCTSPYCNANMSLDTSHMFTIPGKSPHVPSSSSSFVFVYFVPLYCTLSHTHPCMRVVCFSRCFARILASCMPSAVLTHCFRTSGCVWTTPGNFQLGPPGGSQAKLGGSTKVHPRCIITLSSLLQRARRIHLLQYHRLLHRSKYFIAASNLICMKTFCVLLLLIPHNVFLFVLTFCAVFASLISHPCTYI